MEKKVSVVIPNYNGRNLIINNLPKVIKECSDCEIIVVDDASGDDSLDILIKKFPQVKVISLKKNRGFANAVNSGIEKSAGSLILMLNSDVAPRPGFLKEAVKHFTNAKDIFAVGLADYSHEEGRIVVRGKGGGKFKRGFLNHFASKIEQEETLWVSGGSGLFDKEKLLLLNCFDTAFAPFYWEDIDLCYRARKKGFKCIFEPKSKVDHFHEEGAIKSSKSTARIKSASYKNQFLFVWKNISDINLILNHILWLPYNLFLALVKLDIFFFTGFFWALSKLPEIILNFEESNISDKLSDKEILKNFEKQ